MATYKSDYLYPLMHMSSPQYLLILPYGADRNCFLFEYAKPLKTLGYIAFQWSPTVNTYPTNLKYKVWIELKWVNPQAWHIEHLIAVISSFRIVIDHAPINKPNSLKTMMAVITVPDLKHIPHAIITSIWGFSHDIDVCMHSWLEEQILFTHIQDPTPSDQFFKKVQQDNLCALTGYAQ